MATASCNALIMAVHAVDALAGLGENELVNPILADLALEAVGMIRVFTSHDSLIEDRLLADVTAVGAAGTYRRAV